VENDNGRNIVRELNSSDRIVATTTVVITKDGAITASTTETISGDENADPQVPSQIHANLNFVNLTKSFLQKALFINC